MFKTCILGFVWEFGREGRGREGKAMEGWKYR